MFLSLLKRSNRKSLLKRHLHVFRDLNLYFMTILTAVLLLKRRLLKIAKSLVLRTGGNNNSKSRYGNDLIFYGIFRKKIHSYAFVTAHPYNSLPV